MNSLILDRYLSIAGNLANSAPSSICIGASDTIGWLLGWLMPDKQTDKLHAATDSFCEDVVRTAQQALRHEDTAIRPSRRMGQMSGDVMFRATAARDFPASPPTAGRSGMANSGSRADRRSIIPEVQSDLVEFNITQVSESQNAIA